MSLTLGSGKMKDCLLRCKAGEDSLPPQRGWQYKYLAKKGCEDDQGWQDKNYGEWYEDDPSLLLSRDPLSLCSSVTVTSSDRAAGVQGRKQTCGGRWRGILVSFCPAQLW